MMTKEEEFQLDEENNVQAEFLKLEALIGRYFAKKRREAGPYGNPHRGQGRVLSLLKLQPKITQKELSFLLDMRPQSLGELLSKLENSGYLTRKPSEEDRRVMIVELTEKGVEESSKIDQSAEQDTIFDVFSPDEKVVFYRLISKLTKELETLVPEKEREGHPGGFGFGRPFGGRAGVPFDGRGDFFGFEKGGPFSSGNPHNK